MDMIVPIVDKWMLIMDKSHIQTVSTWVKKLSVNSLPLSQNKEVV